MHIFGPCSKMVQTALKSISCDFPHQVIPFIIQFIIIISIIFIK